VNLSNKLEFVTQRKKLSAFFVVKPEEKERGLSVGSRASFITFIRKPNASNGVIEAFGVERKNYCIFLPKNAFPVFPRKK